ncbi:hypothetical protein Ahia01_001361200 [Argonauta hians]
MVKTSVDLIASGTSQHSKKKRDETLLHYLQRLSHLHLESKHLTHIDCDLSVCPQLSVLYLYDNQLTTFPNLSKNLNLTHLYLQDNLIRNIPDLSSLSQLMKLYLSENCITVVEGLKQLTELRELYVDKQKLPPGEKLLLDPRSIRAIGASLQVLNISSNRLTSLTELQALHQLTRLYASDNRLTKLNDIAAALCNMKRLVTLELQHNPVCNVKRYRDKVIVMVKTLETLDDKAISDTSKTFLQNWSANRKALKLKRCAQTVIEFHKDIKQETLQLIGDGNNEVLPKISGYIMPGLPVRKHFSQTVKNSVRPAHNSNNSGLPGQPLLNQHIYDVPPPVCAREEIRFPSLADTDTSNADSL